jgi:hypothetical protein
MNEYRDTNIGVNFTPHRESCRCTDCELDRLQQENKAQARRIAELEAALSVAANCIEYGAFQIGWNLDRLRDAQGVGK